MIGDRGDIVRGKSATTHKLLDALIRAGYARTDAQLAELLQTDRPYISRIRRGKAAVSARLILRIYDVTNLSVEQIRSLI